MNKILIFAGTTEGRMLAEFCISHHIPADVSSATEYGSQLLPEGVGVLCGKMDENDIRALLRSNSYNTVIDATHPYAEQITHTLHAVCAECGIVYMRLLRDAVPVFGETVSDMHEMISVLNENQDIILSTLGIKSVQSLTMVEQFSERIWLRILPSESNYQYCKELGFMHIIQAKGAFTVEDNIRHIRESCAKILLTKESGAIGGYPEKAEAARQTGIRMMTLCRPQETGFSYAEIIAMLLQFQENQI